MLNTANSLRALLAATNKNANREEIAQVYQGWSRSIIEKHLQYKIEVSGEVPLTESCLYVGNHVSFLDIPLVWATTRGVFVSKKEVRAWPLIGKGAEAVGTVFVDRSSLSSRAKVIDSVKDVIMNEKKCVCIFPEGTSSVEGKPWKWGILRLAQDMKIPVQPFRIYYHPLRDTAYMDDDTLLIQVWKMLDTPQRLASIDWGTPRIIKDFKEDCAQIQQWVRSSFDKKRLKMNSGAIEDKSTATT